MRREEGTTFKRLAEEEKPAKKRLRICRRVGGDPGDGVGLVVKQSVRGGVNGHQKSHAVVHPSKMETL